jgi:peptidyl-dipeptidase Dcp
MRPISLTLLLASRLFAAGAQTPTPKPGLILPPAGLIRAVPLAESNPFFKPSPLPYRFPPFDRIKDADFAPAFAAGMSEQRAEVAAIAAEPAAATFENTIVALERSGRLLARVSKTFTNLNASNTDDELQKLEMELAPKLAAHDDAIMLDSALFARVDALHQRRDSLGLDAESAQLLERYHKEFVRAGARLSEADKAALKQLNEALSSLTTQFEQNLLKATKEGAVVVDSLAELDGLSAEQIGAAAEAAKERGLAGKWVIALQNTTTQPVLERLSDRALRERVYRASIARGAVDNTVLVARIVELRAKQAALLGYRDYAAYVLEDESAGTPEAVDKMLSQLGAKALAKAKGEAARIQELIDAQAKARGSKPFKLQPWDWAFYAQQARKARFDFDDARIKPYFELDRVLKDGVFFVARELYGLTFKERKDLPVYRPDVRVFEVFDADGSALGLLVRDDFKRDNKSGGAWMDAYVEQAGLLGQKPVIVNNLNVPKPPAGQPVLLTFDEVITMFHEFGHALHGLLSNVKYPLLAGTSVPRDFVEYPSQLNEMWTREPAVLARFARHYQTGEPMPKALLEKVLASQTSDEGFATSEYLAAAMIDQSWHRLAATSAPEPAGVMAFETRALEKRHMSFGPVPPRYHTPYFAHAFSGGYAAGYYAYIWSEVLARDTGAWFHAHGGISRANGDYFRAQVLSRGRTKEPRALFEQFYGGPPDVRPLLEYRGLVR